MKSLLSNREEQGGADRKKTETWRKQKARTCQTLDGLTTRGRSRRATATRAADATGARIVRRLVAMGVARQATRTGRTAEGGGNAGLEAKVEAAAEGSKTLVHCL